MKRLKAFTLIEMIVALIITIIIVLLTMRFLVNFGGIYSKTLRGEDNSLHLVFLYSTLKRDFYEADSIKGDNNTIVTYTQRRQMVYEFRGNGLFYGDSAHLFSDSLLFDLVDFSATYRNENFVERVAFSFKMNGAPHQVFLSKEYRGKSQYLVNRSNYGD